MARKNRKLGKNVLIEAAMAKGLSARKARQFVNAVIASWTYALWCGEVVQIPGGTIQSKVREGPRRRMLQPFRNVNTGQPMEREVLYQGRRRVVKFKPDPHLTFPLPPPPEPPEEVEARPIASELMGSPVSREMLAVLQHALARRSRPPETFFTRLKVVKSRGIRPRNLDELRFYLAICHYL
jgi:hypothetical protein